MRARQIEIVADLAALMGAVNVVSAVTPALGERLATLAPYLPGVVRQGAHLAAALAGFGLLYLATNLRRRKRAAWYLTELLLAISLVSHLVKGLDWEEALGAGALGFWLWRLRGDFQAQSDRPSVRQGLRVLAGAVAFTLVYGTTGFFLLDRHFSIDFDLAAAVRQTLVMFVAFYDPGLEPHTRFAHYFSGSIYTVAAATLGYAAWMIFRPVLHREPATAAERTRARQIVEAHGHTSLARFTLLDDKAYWFSAGGSVVAYVVKGRIAITLGDPIGPAADFPAAVQGFQAYCLRHDWQPAFYQVLPGSLDAYRAAGFQVLHIGDEASVELNAFTLEGGHNRAIRGVLNRLTRDGYRAEYHAAPLPDALIAELREVSEEWLTLMNGREKRFSLGWFDDAYVRNGPVLVVRTPEGRVSAFANLLPEYRKNEVTIDLMRRRRQVEGGTMDFLFIHLFRWAQAEGYASFNLGLSALSGVGDAPGDPAVERGLHYLYEHVNQFYNFKGLHAFKGKFHPRWEPRYLIYAGAVSLPAVALALIRADSGDEFVRDYLHALVRKRRSDGEARPAA